MSEQVVSSRFGQRPLLEVPALEVFNAHRSIGSLQEDRPLPHPTLGRSGFTAPQVDPNYYRQHHPPHPYPNLVGGQAPPISSYYGMNPPQQRDVHTVPSYNMAPNHNTYTYGPHGQVAGGQVAPTYYNPYPGVQSPYYIPPPQQQQQPPPPPPPVITHRVADDTWVMEGVLEFGRIATIHLKRSSPCFTSLPDFMKRELKQTYGKYPKTDIRITADRGEYHIYARPQGFADEEDYPRSFNSHRSDTSSKHQNPSYRPRDVDRWYDWDPQNRRDDDFLD